MNYVDDFVEHTMVWKDHPAQYLGVEKAAVRLGQPADQGGCPFFSDSPSLGK